MLNSTVLDVAIGLALVYFLLSVMCSTVRELVARALHERERGLVDGIHRLLGAAPPGSAIAPSAVSSIMKSGADLAARTLDHPLVRGMATRAGKAPAYVPGHGFALALLDVLCPSSHGPTTIDELRAAIHRIDDPVLHRILLPLVDTAGADLAAVRSMIERRFDDVMDRVSGWYKRRTQLWVFVAAFVAAGIGNIDSLAIASTLYREPTVRAFVIASAASQQAPPPAPGWDAYQSSSETLRALQLPIGWEGAKIPMTPGAVLRKVVGILLTVLALMLGAPFWFDVLSRIANLRAAGPKPPPGAAASFAAASVDASGLGASSVAASSDAPPS